MDRQEEALLATRLLAGEPEAFESFVHYFRAKVFQYSWLMCGHREDAEEVAQETLLKVLQNFSQLKDPSHVRSWVFRIAKNACLMQRRKSVFAPEQELSLDQFLPSSTGDGEHRQIEIADWSRLPEDELLRSEMKDALHRAIRTLPEAYRSVVLLRDIEGLSTEEAAQVLEVSADAVKQRLHRGRLALRQQLDGYLKAAAPAVL